MNFKLGDKVKVNTCKFGEALCIQKGTIIRIESGTKKGVEKEYYVVRDFETGTTCWSTDIEPLYGLSMTKEDTLKAFVGGVVVVILLTLIFLIVRR